MLKYALLTLVVAAAVSSGCASKKPEVVAQPKVEVPDRPAHKGPVCLLERWLPTGTKYEELDDVDAKKGWYGSIDSVLPMLADEAREEGANVVMRMRTGMSVGAIAWARPYAEGKAVWAPDFTDEMCEKLGGKLL